ncbi:MAG TPA: ROK family transcriptional regulator [Pseudonocardiaceae bacterium]|jgi:predicted NBD/HSP70 family sugar kinase
MPESRWTTRALRKYNRAAALSRLYEQGSASRQELAELTGLSSATVTNVITELLADGLVVEAGSVSSAGGRPRGILRVATENLRVAGVDVGETEIRVGLFDGALNPLEMTSRSPGSDLAPAHVVGLVTDAIAEVTANSGVPLLGVGVGVPGAVDERPGTESDDGLVYAPTLGWDAVPFGSMVAAGAGAPVHLENCATALGQAEMWFGAGRGARRAVVTLLGVGIGAALMTSDSSPRGGSGLTSEWGHTVVTIDGRPCRCGSQGCLEAYVGADAVLARYRDSGGEMSTLGPQEALRALIARADTDDLARTVLDDTAKVLGVGVGNLINLLAPDRVVIAGWAGLVLGPSILPKVREVARRHALPHAYGAVTIGLGESGQDAVARGAASLPMLALLRSGSLPADTSVRAG